MKAFGLTFRTTSPSWASSLRAGKLSDGSYGKMWVKHPETGVWMRGIAKFSTGENARLTFGIPGTKDAFMINMTTGKQSRYKDWKGSNFLAQAPPEIAKPTDYHVSVDYCT